MLKVVHSPYWFNLVLASGLIALGVSSDTLSFIEAYVGTLILTVSSIATISHVVHERE